MLRRDHHCPWIVNCVGFNNYKTFFHLVVYIILVSIIVCASYWKKVVLSLQNKNVSLGMCYLVCLEYCMGLAFVGVLSYFMGFHIWIIVHGMTTSEYNNYIKDVNKPRSHYNISCYVNWKSIFGNNVCEWLVPFSNFLM